MGQHRCSQCAEKVKAGALVCRHCGHEFGAEERAVVARATRDSGLVKLVLLLVLPAALVFGLWESNRTQPGDDRPCNPAAARQMVDDATAAGVVWRADGARLIVDDAAWSASAFEARQMLAGAWACELGGGDTRGQTVAVRSRQTGRLLATFDYRTGLTPAD